MEVPYNTTIFKEMKIHGQNVAPVADWHTKRDWVDYAFAELEKAGYTVDQRVHRGEGSGAHEVSLPRSVVDRRGHDRPGRGVVLARRRHALSERSRIRDRMSPSCRQGKLPIYRALTPTREERMIRELILQMKLGHVQTAYFQNKFGVDVGRAIRRFRWTNCRSRVCWRSDRDNLRLNRDGLLQVDRLLHEFFLPEHRTRVTRERESAVSSNICLKLRRHRNWRRTGWFDGRGGARAEGPPRGCAGKGEVSPLSHRRIAAALWVLHARSGSACWTR